MDSTGFVTLKLDATYRPVGIVEALEALVMCIIGKAKVLEEHDSVIRSPSKSFKLPAVIVINRVVKYTFLTTRPNRRNICIRDDNTCQYCAKQLNFNDLTIDHVFPKSRGGKNEWENLVACCKKCNQKKSSNTPKEAGMKLIKKPETPRTMSLKFKSHTEDIWKDYLW
tara:strand:- start:7084 stop:7587 length:504 start_codon:yes stop_codon:yes gene_type:complete